MLDDLIEDSKFDKYKETLRDHQDLVLDAERLEKIEKRKTTLRDYLKTDEHEPKRWKQDKSLESQD